MILADTHKGKTMAKNTQIQIRMTETYKSKLLAVAEIENTSATELIESLLDPILEQYDYCEQCGDCFRESHLEGMPGDFICRGCLEGNAPEERGYAYGYREGWRDGSKGKPFLADGKSKPSPLYIGYSQGYEDGKMEREVSDEIR